MTTRIEATRYSVLAWCEVCPQWTYLAGDRKGARQAAKEHESKVHTGSDRAASRVRQHRFRDTPKEIPTQ